MAADKEKSKMLTVIVYNDATCPWHQIQALQEWLAQYATDVLSVGVLNPPKPIDIIRVEL